MARPRRMGAYNALEDLPPRPSARPAGRLTGPALLRPWLEPVPDPPPPERPGAGRAPRRPAGRNALDDLLPGPEQDTGDDADLGAGPAPARPWLEPVPDLPEAPPRRSRRMPGRNALDELLPGPASGVAALGGPGLGEDGPKARITLRLPAELLEAVRDAAAHLAGPPTYLSIAALAEQALRAELDRLSADHNHGRPFPPRPGSPAARR